MTWTTLQLLDDFLAPIARTARRFKGMTREEAIAALAQVLSSELHSIGVAALSRPNAALASTPEILARAAVEWCASLGVSFADAPSVY